MTSPSSSAQAVDAEKSEEDCTCRSSTRSQGTRKRKDTATATDATEDTATPPQQRVCRRSPLLIPEEDVNQHDIICGRRNSNYCVLKARPNNTMMYAGNTRFRTLLAAVHPDYCLPHTTTNQKIRLIKMVVEKIQSRTPPGRFLYQTSSEEEKEGDPNLDGNNPNHRCPPPQLFEVLGSFCSIQITRDELNNFGRKTIERTRTSNQQTTKKAATTAATSNSKRTTSPPAKTKKRQKKQPVTPNTTAFSSSSQNKKTAPATKKNKASSDDDDDDKFYDPISSSDSAEEKQEEAGDDDNADADTTPANRDPTTPPTSAATVMKRKKPTTTTTPRTSSSNTKTKPSLKDSYWKSIQSTVGKKMEQHLKSGKLFPKLPTTGVWKQNKGKNSSYEVRVFFEKQNLYLGSWKRPEIAAQARLYAKELIDEDENENDDDNDNDGDDLNEEVKQELDRIRTVVKAKMTMKTDLDCTGNIAMNQDSGNDGSVAISSSQASTTKKTLKQPKVKGYYKVKSGNYKVLVGFLGKQQYFGTYKSEREAAAAYTIAKDEMSQSRVLIPLTTKTTAKNKDWELIRTEIQNIIETATPNEIKEMLVIHPKVKKKGYYKRPNGKFETKLWFEKKSRHIGIFEDESEAELAYLLAYHKKINYIPSSNSATTAVVSERPSSTPISLESPPPQMLSPTEEVSTQSTPPALALAAAAAAKRDNDAAISSSTATTNTERQKLSNINDYNVHHDDVSPKDNTAGVEDDNTVPSAEPKKGTLAKLKAFLVITTATTSEGHDRLREEVVSINNTNRRRLTNPITTIAATSPVPSVLTTTTTTLVSASSSLLSSQTTQNVPVTTFRSSAASAAEAGSGAVAKSTAEEDEGTASEKEDGGEEEDYDIINFDDKNEQQQQPTATESSQSQSQQYNESEAAKMQLIFKKAVACELRRKNDEGKELQQRLRQQHEQQTKQQWLRRNLQSSVHKSLLWLLSVSFLKRTTMAVQVKRQNKTEHEQQTDEKQQPWLIQKLHLLVHTLLVLTVSVLERAAAVIEFKRQNEREKQLRQLREEKLEQLKRANQPWLVKKLQLLVHKLLLLPVTSSLPSAWVRLLSTLTWDQTETMILYGHDILQQQQKDDINVEILLLKRIRQVREQKTVSTTAATIQSSASMAREKIAAVSLLSSSSSSGTMTSVGNILPTPRPPLPSPNVAAAVVEANRESELTAIDVTREEDEEGDEDDGK